MNDNLCGENIEFILSFLLLSLLYFWGFMGIGSLRIIGGRWRGKKIPILDHPELRPTSNRVRETLFNWLQRDIQNARCLDLFAGSGSLSFEALSRGAEKVFLVDGAKPVVRQLQTTVRTLATHQAVVLQQQLPADLPIDKHSIDIVFLDPPFGQQWFTVLLPWLEKKAYLKANAIIYIETEKTLALPQLPQNWQLYKQAKAGQVAFYLIQCKAY
jgi:16S rRNA (guanine966-N2)-methyltransferase